jgi:outer membrane protein assembly factor BamA
MQPVADDQRMCLLARRLLRIPLILAGLCCTAAIAADNAPSIREIAFEGNDTTRDKVMLREVVIHVGDPADSDRVEQSRQAIQDLGLFRAVTVREEPVDGGVRIVFTVKEKWYVLPLPRVGYDSDHNFNFGGQLLWYNVAGLDHTLKLNWVRGGSGDATRGTGQSWSIDYNAPVIDDSLWTMDVSGGHSRSPVVTPAAYDEYFDKAQVIMSRSLSSGPASQGWHAGGGLLWQREYTQGQMAPAPYGEALALVGVGGYRDLHDLLYSDEGTAFNGRVEIAERGLLSDYGYEQFTVDWRRDFTIGNTPYQSLNFIADSGLRFDGPTQHPAFGIGGRHDLRAYSSGFADGNLYYHVGIEYLHPIVWNWLRGLVALEAADVYDRPRDFTPRRIHTSLGVGLRLRVNWLVNFQLEAGAAIPLDKSGSPRFFGGRV